MLAFAVLPKVGLCPSDWIHSLDLLLESSGDIGDFVVHVLVVVGFDVLQAPVLVSETRMLGVVERFLQNLGRDVVGVLQNASEVHRTVLGHRVVDAQPDLIAQGGPHARIDVAAHSHAPEVVLDVFREVLYVQRAVAVSHMLRLLETIHNLEGKLALSPLNDPGGACGDSVVKILNSNVIIGTLGSERPAGDEAEAALLLELLPGEAILGRVLVLLAGEGELDGLLEYELAAHRLHLQQVVQVEEHAQHGIPVLHLPHVDGLGNLHILLIGGGARLEHQLSRAPVDSRHRLQAGGRLDVPADEAQLRLVVVIELVHPQDVLLQGGLRACLGGLELGWEVAEHLQPGVEVVLVSEDGHGAHHEPVHSQHGGEVAVVCGVGEVGEEVPRVLLSKVPELRRLDGQRKLVVDDQLVAEDLGFGLRVSIQISDHRLVGSHRRTHRELLGLVQNHEGVRLSGIENCLGLILGVDCAVAFNVPVAEQFEVVILGWVGEFAVGVDIVIDLPDLGDELEPLVVGNVQLLPALREGVAHESVVDGVWTEREHTVEQDHL